jgi:hypothetical protein
MSTFEDHYRTWHTWISYVKSGIRIVTGIAALGCMYYVTVDIAVIILAIGLIIAEVLGIAEEFV